MKKHGLSIVGTLVLIALAIAAAPYVAKGMVFAFVTYLQVFAIIVVISMLFYLACEFFGADATKETHSDGSTSWTYEF